MTTGTPALRDAPNYYITEHFRYGDLICPCCDQLMLVPAVYRHMSMLESLQRELGIPLVVTSGFRCEKHNAAVGGQARSWHLLFATDVTLRDTPVDTAVLKELYRLADTVGFGGVGLYDEHVHLDLRPEPARWKV